MKRSTLMFVLVAALLPPTLVRAQHTPPTPPEPPEPPSRRMLPPPGLPEPMVIGIPPRVAARIGMSDALQKKVQELSFDANEKLIDLEAKLSREQLALDRLLAADKPDASRAFAQIEQVSRAEAEVRKNRIGLMLKIRDTVGPELWRKLEAEMPMQRIKVKRKIKRLRGGRSPEVLIEDRKD